MRRGLLLFFSFLSFLFCIQPPESKYSHPHPVSAHPVSAHKILRFLFFIVLWSKKPKKKRDRSNLCWCVLACSACVRACGCQYKIVRRMNPSMHPPASMLPSNTLTSHFFSLFLSLSFNNILSSVLFSLVSRFLPPFSSFSRLFPSFPCFSFRIVLLPPHFFLFFVVYLSPCVVMKVCVCVCRLCT